MLRRSQVVEIIYISPNATNGSHVGVDVSLNVSADGAVAEIDAASDLAPTPDAFQKRRGSPHGTGEAYIAKLSMDGRRLVYFSWLGGNGYDEIETEGISDGSGNFFVAGSTGSVDFPTTRGAFQTVLSGGGGDQFADAWVARIDNGGALGAATLFGGSTEGPEAFFGPVVDDRGNIYATGRFRSDDVPVTSNALQPLKAGPSGVQDAFVAVFSPDATRLLYGSYFGGSGLDRGRHIGIHRTGREVYVIGETESGDLPLRDAAQTTPGGAFMAMFRVGEPSRRGRLP